MGKTILHRLFGVGRIPERLRPILDAEGLQVWDEGIGGWISMKNFKAPGKRFYRRMTGFTGFLAVTRKRVLAFVYGKPIINVPLDHANFKEMSFNLISDKRFDVGFESSLFHKDWSGRIDVRFHTDKARQFAGVLETASRERR